VISALSDAVLVTCGSLYSGALITANHAIEQGKPVYALPGPVDTSDGEGPMKLLRDGAKAACCADDILSPLDEQYPGSIDIFRLKDEPDISLSEAVLRYRVKCKSDPKRSHTSLRDIFPHKKDKKAKPQATVNSEFHNGVDTQQLSNEEKAVLNVLPQGDFTVDEISSSIAPIGELCATLTMLEIYGYVRSLPGGRYRRIR
jgi:DNA processing protein